MSSFREAPQAQEQGRMILSLALDAIVEDHLIHDRVEPEPDAMEALMQSASAGAANACRCHRSG